MWCWVDWPHPVYRRSRPDRRGGDGPAWRNPVDEHFKTSVDGIWPSATSFPAPCWPTRPRKRAPVEYPADQATHINYDAIPSVAHWRKRPPSADGRTAQRGRHRLQQGQFRSWRIPGRGQWRYRRLCEDIPTRQPTNARRSHRRPGRWHADRRTGAGHGVRRFIRGCRADMPCTSDAERGGQEAALGVEGSLSTFSGRLARSGHCLWTAVPRRLGFGNLPARSAGILLRLSIYSAVAESMAVPAWLKTRYPNSLKIRRSEARAERL